MVPATVPKIIPPEIQITTTGRKNNGLNKWKLIKSTGANILPVSTRKFITCVSNSSIATLLDYNDDQNHSFVHCIPLDRKSTRLHSSHVSTSYAVFCLTTQPSTVQPQIMT